MIKDLIVKNRSYRRFNQEVSIGLDLLKELVEMARLSPSAANLQPLKYILSYTHQQNDLIFSHLSWAGYLKAWGGPSEGEKPAAYIIMLGDKRISQTFGCDQGIAAQSILLGAVDKGLGGCIIGSIERQGLCKTFEIPSYYEVLLVIALGKPKETVVIETLGTDEDIKYWRDAKGVHHVPKRKLDDIIIQ